MTDENNLPELPEGWVWTNINEITFVTKLAGFEYTKYFNYIEDGPVRVVRGLNLGHGFFKPYNYRYINRETSINLPRSQLTGGEVLFAYVGTLGNMAILPNDNYRYHLGPNVGKIVVNYALKNGKYILYYLLSGQGQLQLFRKSKAVAQSSLSMRQIRSVNIPIPPLNEQHRIVAKIEELFTRLDAGVSALTTLKTQLKRYRQAVLKSAMEGKLTAEWREEHKGELEPASVLLERIKKERRERLGKKYKELPPVDKEELGELPDGWEWSSLGEVGDLNRGKSKHRPRNAPKLYGGSYPFIQTGDIRHANGIVYKYHQTYNEEGLKQSKLWPVGTLCITIAANIADTAILGIDACFPDSIVGFQTKTENCDIHFVEYYFRDAKENIERYAPATAQKNINLRILSDLAIPLPSVTEQNVIVEEIDQIFSICNNIDNVIDQSLARAERLRQSILKRAFEGELVPQNPADEPANKLLERIKAEKKRGESTRHKRKKS